MWRLIQKCVLCGLGLTMLLATTASAQRPQLNALMQEKLEHSQDLLEALILTEYDVIDRLARELVRVSEVSAWSSSQDSSYLNYASDFRDTAELLIEEAQAEDIDGIALSYMEMTLTCVRCHRFLSRQRLAN